MFSSSLGGFGGFGGLSSGIIQGDQELAGGFFGGLPVETKPIPDKSHSGPSGDIFDAILDSVKPGNLPTIQPKPSDSVFDNISGHIGVAVPERPDVNDRLPPSIRDDNDSSPNPNKKHIVHGAIAGGATVLAMTMIVKKPISTSLLGGLVVGSATYWLMAE